jgi:hypothetical protein
MSISKNKGMNELRGVYTLNVDDMDNKYGQKGNKKTQRGANLNN